MFPLKISIFPMSHYENITMMINTGFFNLWSYVLNTVKKQKDGKIM